LFDCLKAAAGSISTTTHRCLCPLYLVDYFKAAVVTALFLYHNALPPLLLLPLPQSANAASADIFTTKCRRLYLVDC
jgi:hypothetical protein